MTNEEKEISKYLRIYGSSLTSLKKFYGTDQNLLLAIITAPPHIQKLLIKISASWIAAGSLPPRKLISFNSLKKWGNDLHKILGSNELKKDPQNTKNTKPPKPGKV